MSVRQPHWGVGCGVRETTDGQVGREPTELAERARERLLEQGLAHLEPAGCKAVVQAELRQSLGRERKRRWGGKLTLPFLLDALHLPTSPLVGSHDPLPHPPSLSKVLDQPPDGARRRSAPLGELDLDQLLLGREGAEAPVEGLVERFGHYRRLSRWMRGTEGVSMWSQRRR